MIKMTKCADLSVIDKAFEYVEGAVGYIATDESGTLGHSVFRVEKELVKLLKLDAKDGDFAIADGLARASLFSCMENCKYAMLVSDGGGLIDRFAKSINAEAGKAIELEKVFSGCAGCT